MGRPREFDEDEVLERALDAFWTHGLESTSISDLMKATGLAKGSLYKAFGDKRTLMLTALRRYLERGYGSVRATLLDAPSATEGIENWLACVVRSATSPCGKGCLAVNATVERGSRDPEITELLVAHRTRIERLFEDVIARGVERGELRADLEPAVAAKLISTLVNGLQVSGKAGLTKSQADAQIALALSALRG